ncbi:hypothetical protein SPLC1_S240650 [Arthrospira platensis C1]|nr:hypothetical protein SPLC1_S240650 [Arthrospira platensis C1]
MFARSPGIGRCSEIRIKPLTPELRQLDQVFCCIIGNRDEFNGKRMLTFGLTMFLLATLRFWLTSDAELEVIGRQWLLLLDY